MKRAYNRKISERANDCLRKRERTLQVRRQIFVLVGIILVSFAILLGSSIRAFASSRDRRPLHKYYTSVQVEKGDTLWDIADSYIVDGTMSRTDFIEEVSSINGLSDGLIHSGGNIVVVYYAE